MKILFNLYVKFVSQKYSIPLVNKTGVFPFFLISNKLDSIFNQKTIFFLLKKIVSIQSKKFLY